MSSDAEWQPSGTLRALRTRATMLAAARGFLQDRGALEVETPMLAPYGVTDVGIESLRVTKPHAQFWLRTSPEYHMKRLLAAGYPDIFQVGKVFRAGEAGRRHQPEFTMIEWYRHGFDLAAMVSECCELIIALSEHGRFPVSQYRRVTYREAFTETTAIDPFTATNAELANAASRTPGWRPGLAAQLENDRPALLDLLAAECVYPALPGGILNVICDFPADQAMLARLRPGDPPVADRFEVLLNGIELANGFRELQDSNEQRLRFETDNRRRSEQHLSRVDPDALLLRALEAGLPDCAGVAVGLDRVLMTTDGHDDIRAVISFPAGQ